MNMTVEKKTIRSDIPGHHTFLNGSAAYVGSPSEETRRMIVGKDIALNGDVSACEHLIIEGTVQSALFTARRLDIIEPGLFAGTAEVQDAVIAGRFEGRLVVAGRLTVKSTGRIYGEVEYGILEVEGGGKIEGQVQAAPQQSAQSAQPAPEAPVAEQNTPSNVEPLFDRRDEEEEGEEGKETSFRRPQAFRRAIGY